jgi:hypothetical protein
MERLRFRLDAVSRKTYSRLTDKLYISWERTGTAGPAGEI